MPAVGKPSVSHPAAGNPGVGNPGVGEPGLPGVAGAYTLDGDQESSEEEVGEWFPG